MIPVAFLAVAGLSSPVAADTQPTYDKRIEEAAIQMLIPKLGDMRGSLDLKSDEFLRPIAKQRVLENKPVGVPGAHSREHGGDSFLFF